MTQNAIIVQDLTYRYGDLLAVDQINFNVAEGEILGFLGPNGAGKSTTVKMLTGQIQPKGGQAIVLGLDIAVHPKQGVKDFDAEALITRVGLDGRGSEKVAGYSKGMKQRLMVARALINRPSILFLDEPTEGLDPTSSAAIRKIILEERERGATIFLTTHDMVEADKLSDRVAFIDQGVIVALDTPHALKQQYGKRMLRAEVGTLEGGLITKEIILDRAETAGEIEALFSNERVVTVHSEEATLEDIFIKITGRGLV